MTQINNIPCRWWATPICGNNTTHYIVMTCPQGHLRERLLCDLHTTHTTINIHERLLLCPQCQQPLCKYLTTHPIYDHYNLTAAINDTTPIHTINDPDGTQTTWIDWAKTTTTKIDWCNEPELQGILNTLTHHYNGIKPAQKTLHQTKKGPKPWHTSQPGSSP
jgi:hypothetical protein